MRMRRAVLIALVLAFCVPPAWATESRTVEGIRFSERVDVGAERSLALCAAELLRYRRVFRGYVAALYEEACNRRGNTESARRLELSYFWDIPGEKFGPAAVAVLERSFTNDALAPLRERVETFHGAYRDINAGDRYTLTYVPGQGTELAWNGTPLVRVPGADFANAYFAIWLGTNPVDPGLRDRLLGTSNPK